MSVLLLTYSATAYLFSGSVCYAVSKGQAKYPHRSSGSLLRFWIAFLWPLWMLSQINREESFLGHGTNGSSVQREFLGSGSRSSRR